MYIYSVKDRMVCLFTHARYTWVCTMFCLLANKLRTHCHFWLPLKSFCIWLKDPVFECKSMSLPLKVDLLCPHFEQQWHMGSEFSDKLENSPWLSACLVFCLFLPWLDDGNDGLQSLYICKLKPQVFLYLLFKPLWPIICFWYFNPLFLSFNDNTLSLFHSYHSGNLSLLSK
jgi:hypothetical protein